MKVFISWHGDLSHQVAMILREWLRNVIQSMPEPYVSSEDIQMGARWVYSLATELEQSNFGIVCITRHNLESPWINFEAGALSKSLETGRVSPLLVDIRRSELRGPLAQFQSTVLERSDVFKLVHSLNESVDPPLLDKQLLDRQLEVWWPRLESQLSDLPPDLPDSPVQSSAPPTNGAAQTVIIEEILELVRSLQRLLATPGEVLPADYLRRIITESAVDGLSSDSTLLDDLAAAWIEFLEGEGEGQHHYPADLIVPLERLDRSIENVLDNADPSYHRVVRQARELRRLHARTAEPVD